MTEAIHAKDTTVIYVVSNRSETVAHRGETVGRIDTILSEAGIPARVTHVPQAQDLGEAVVADSPAVLCLEAGVDDKDSERLLGLATAVSPRAPILILNGQMSDSQRAHWIENGAFDVVALDPPTLLQRRLEQAVAHAVRGAELNQTRKHLSQAQRRLDVLLSQDQEAEVGLTAGITMSANSAFAQLFGFADADTANGIEFSSLVAESDRERVTDAFAQINHEGVDSALIFDAAARNGQVYPVRALLHRGISEDDSQRINLVMRAVESPPARETARHGSYDGRLALHRLLASPASRAQEWGAGLIFVAVDEIDELQARVGLAHGDLLLQEAGLFLLQGLRDIDRCFRFGAGEYVLLIERHSEGEIREAAERLHQGLSKEVFGDDTHSASVTVSMAYTVLSGDAAHQDQRLLAVMQKAYALRADGGNACDACVGEQPGGTESVSVRRWAALLKQGLAEDRFSLAYQAITSLAGDSQPYFDVLIRYIDDRGALVRAGEFMPAADQAGMMPDIDRWVTQRAIDVIWQQRAKDMHMALFIKLSSATLAAGTDFTNWLQRTMDSRPFDRSSILFCVREDDLRAQTQSAQTLCEEVTRLGCRVAMTHYGSTPKSLEFLDTIPTSFIKLSPDFARRVLGGEQDERLASVISGAKERGIPLIAEHIEDANSMAHLWQAGVNYVQGHFIQEPDTQALSQDDTRMI